MPFGDNQFTSFDSRNYNFGSSNRNHNSNLDFQPQRDPVFQGNHNFGNNLDLPKTAPKIDIPTYKPMELPQLSLPEAPKLPEMPTLPTIDIPKASPQILPEHKPYFPKDNQPAFIEIIKPLSPIMRNIPSPRKPEPYPFPPHPWGWWKAMVDEAFEDPAKMKELKQNLGKLVKILKPADQGSGISFIFDMIVNKTVSKECDKLNQEILERDIKISTEKAKQILREQPLIDCLMIVDREKIAKEDLLLLDELIQVDSELKKEKAEVEKKPTVTPLLSSMLNQAKDMGEAALKGAATLALNEGMKAASLNLAQPNSFPMQAAKKVLQVSFDLVRGGVNLACKARDKAKEPETQAVVGGVLLASTVGCNIQ